MWHVPHVKVTQPLGCSVSPKPHSHDPAHSHNWDLAVDGWSDDGEWSDVDWHGEK